MRFILQGSTTHEYFIPDEVLEIVRGITFFAGVQINHCLFNQNVKNCTGSDIMIQ